MCDNKKVVIKIRKYEKADYDVVCKLFYNGMVCLNNKGFGVKSSVKELMKTTISSPRRASKGCY